MDKKGFTLVELLAVIILLAIIFVLTFPAVEKVIFQGRDVVSNSQINTILDAAYDLSLQNVELLPDSGKTTFITLADLKKAGLIESDITDPETKKLYSDSLVISIKNVGSGYKYTSENAKLKGDYLYTVILNPSEEHKPTITLSSLTRNSEGNYVTQINLNSTFTDVSYTATSSDGVDLTSRVVVSITFNNTVVSEVDTSKLGIYKINYTVVDDYGYSTTVVRSVIITDTELPVLILPENTTISTSETEFDLLEGVTCTDNSGECDITTSGTIEFGVVNKYTIVYTAQDPTGNTTTSERIITIE